MTEQMTEAQLSLLSAEEREALQGDDVDVDALKAIAGEGDEEPEGEEAKVIAKADDKPADKTDAADKTEDEPTERKQDGFTPTYQAAAVEDYDAKMTAFSTQKTELRRQLSDGDIDIDAYEQAKDAIIANEFTLREQKIKADISAEQQEQIGTQRWQWEQEKFFTDPTNALYKDAKALAKFDTVVRVLGNDSANATKDGPWFLQEADRITRVVLGIEKAPVTPEKKADSRKPDLSVVPKTLSHLPAADIVQTGDADEFAHLDRLEGLAYEKAVARLSPVERERFLKSA